jgi:hypothetical protein
MFRLEESIVINRKHTVLAALTGIGVLMGLAEASAQQSAPRPVALAASPDQIEATLSRLITVPLTDPGSTQALRATLAAAEIIAAKQADPVAAKRMKSLIELGQYQVDSWQALRNWTVAFKEWKALPGAEAEKGPAPAYSPPPKPGVPVAAPPPPPVVDPNRYDPVADAKSFALYRELECLDGGLMQLQLLRVQALQFGDAKAAADELLICPIVARCEALTSESVAAQLSLREDLPSLSAALKTCSGVAASAGGDAPILAGILRRISRLSLPEEVNRLRIDYIAAKVANEPSNLAGVPSQESATP